MDDTEFNADCQNCAGLCCVAFDFERSDDFAIDKPAGAACPHLGADHACKIHASRADFGFRGCIAFDCHGAGQVYTADLLPAGGWRGDAAACVTIARDFPLLLRLFRSRHLLTLAAGLVRDPGLEAQRQEILARASRPADGWNEERLAAADALAIERDAIALLGSLRNLAETSNDKRKRRGRD